MLSELRFKISGNPLFVKVFRLKAANLILPHQWTEIFPHESLQRQLSRLLTIAHCESFQFRLEIQMLRIFLLFLLIALIIQDAARRGLAAGLLMGGLGCSGRCDRNFWNIVQLKVFSSAYVHRPLTKSRVRWKTRSLTFLYALTRFTEQPITDRFKST